MHVQRELSRTTVRRIMIAAQGLDRERPATQPADVLACIERMALLQIDTIHVVNRSPYWVLWSRIGNYPLHWLDALLADGALFECWAHEACFAPRRWLPAQLRLIADRVHPTKTRWSRPFLETHAEAATAMLAVVAERGEVRSSDFRRTEGKRGTWWAWSHEKTLLEALFADGALTVARRERFQRVYTLTSTKHPELESTALPDRHEVFLEQVRATMRALGVVHVRWLGDYFRMRGLLESSAQRLQECGELIPVTLAGIPGQAWVWHEYAAWIDHPPVCGHTTLLMPFDPLVWDRRRALEVFGFDYKIECYTPAPRRIYGYFTLPVLYHDQIVGRFDCKAHRTEGIFTINHAHFEADRAPDPAMYAAIAAAVQRCATWHGTPVVRLVATSPTSHHAGLAVALGG